MAKKSYHDTYEDADEASYRAAYAGADEDLGEDPYEDPYDDPYDDPYVAADFGDADDALADDDDDFDLDDAAVDLGAAAPRTGFRVAAGVFDFIGVAVCTVLILGLIVIMGNLYQWLRQDLNSTFAGIGKNINEAVVMDAHKNQ